MKKKINSSEEIIENLRKENQELKKLIENLLLENTTDYLTGVLNRKTITDYISHEIERCRRYGGRFSIAMIDLDDFKKINDAFGHLFGDSVIQSVSRIITRIIRSADRAGRIGGEEFLLFYPETKIEDALDITERVRQGVEKNQLLSEGGNVKITFTGSVCEYNPSFASVSDYLSILDKTLKTLKKAGAKNQIKKAGG